MIFITLSRKGIALMFKNNLLLKIVFFIAVITIFSGSAQMLMPQLILAIIGGDISPGGNYSFGIIGMFMVLFGGLCIHALSTETQEPVAILWCSLQKLGAAIAVTLAVCQHLFSWLALLVSSFDFLSFVLMYIFWYRIKNNVSRNY